MDGKEEKKPNLFLRILAFLVTMAMVLGAIVLVANWQKLNFDSIRRWFIYRSLQRNEAGQAESFPYGGGEDSAFAQVGEDLLVCSPSGIRLYTPDGSPYVDLPCQFEHPTCAVSGATAVVYDAGGTELFVYRNRESVFTYTAEEGHTILSASLSAQGLLAIVLQSGGRRETVMAYDITFQPLMKVDLNNRFITDAVLSPDRGTLAVATAGQSEGSYDSQLYFYSLSRTQDSTPDAVCPLGSGAVLKLLWKDRTLQVLSEDALTLVRADGAMAGQYTFGGRFLKGFSLDADGFSALLLSRYRAGTVSELVLVDMTGTEIASMTVMEQILSLSAAGRYVCLLTADVLYIYTDTLELYHSLRGAHGARKVLQRSDGSVTLITEETARLYLPD